MCSCKKDSVGYPITYSSNLISESSIKVYTKDGEVTSPALINNFVNRYQDYLSGLGNAKIKGKIVATYLSADSVELTINNIKEAKRRSVHEIAGVIYWEKQDTTWSGFGPLFKVEDVYKYHPIYYIEYNAQIGSGYTKYTIFKDCYFMIKNGGKLSIPMFDFIEIHFGEKWQSSLGNNNSFNKDGLTKFFVNDTMLIQSYLIEMK